jgi:hypothetical protein
MPNIYDKLWLNWIHISGCGKKERVECIYCKNNQLKNATKYRKHTQNCGKAPQSVRKQFRDSFKSKISKAQKELSHRDNDGSVFSTQLDETASARAYTVPSNCMEIVEMSDDEMDRPMSQMSSTSFASMDSFVNKMSKETNIELQELFAKAMISGGLPFKWIENKYLKMFFDKIGSGFHLPTEKQLKGSIFNKIHDKTEVEINKLVKESDSITIAIDGWKNIRSLSVVNIMTCVPESIFYKSIEVYGESVDNKLIQREVEKVMQTIGENKIAAIITDNGSPMIAAQNELKKIYKHLIGIRCSAHVLNLLIEDSCKLKTIHDHIIITKSIIKEITRS